MKSLLIKHFSFLRVLCISFSFFFLLQSCKKDTLFQLVSSSHSGIHFKNEIIENDSVNSLDLTNIYNGGGVGIGDFNNDGLQDIYFTGNMVSNKLYLNKGNFKFQDVTDEAGVRGNGEWCRGVAVVDINNDGLLDMYVCATLASNPQKRKNLLYINQGIDKNGVPHFKEMAKEYGLDDTTQSTMAEFFDYDNDGDLDMYLVVNQIQNNRNPAVFTPIITNGSFPSTGRLYRNDWNDSLKHPFFTDVSKQAGITIEGYGHDATIADINQDGWKDIFVSNDFLSDDILYINNHNGTFTDESKKYFKHTSANGMGQDIEDINNDGLADIVEMDMNPEDNYRKKMMLGGNSYQTFLNFDHYGYQYQYVRNSLQLNDGSTLGQNDSISIPAFSDIGFMSGISETDWSWTPLVTDFDNDGNRDIIITNGYPRDVTDHDFITYRQEASQLASKKNILAAIPQVKLHNYAFKNNGNLTFSNVSDEWGLSAPTFSNGAAYADLDNDGDMDMIVNNINDEAMIYRNMSREKNKTSSNFLQIQFTGGKQNINGIGAFAEIHYDHGKKQVYENTPYRGYLSTIQNIAHFGLGKVGMIDSVIIKWPNSKMQLLRNVKANQVLKVDIKNADLNYSFSHDVFAKNSLFKEVTDSVNIHYQHQENDYIDFNIQKLLPHKFSQYGPALAVGDVNGDGLDDIICGGSTHYSAQIFLQQKNGTFIQKSLLPKNAEPNKMSYDEGLLLFDADGDGDLDLYITSGGYENDHNSPTYQDHLFVNDGKGNFTEDTTALPKNFTSKFCVRAFDYNKDGKPDLFVSGRVDPWNYPKPVSSFIFRNDSKNGHIQFTDVTGTVAKDLVNIGLVCDAICTDFDGDGWPDLILAGEWMPITFLKNDHGVFKNVTQSSGISKQIGWWNTIAAGDFDNDGDIDYIVGNLGQNSFYKASDQYPVSIYAKDFDNNGSYDAFTSVYLPASQEDTTRKEFPAESRDDIIKQMISMRARFKTYKSYAVSTMDSVITESERKGALIYHANSLSSCYLRNDGNGKFTMIPLPALAQISVLDGMSVEDVDGDGNLDVVISGNDFGTEVSTGRYDAFNGLVLKGDGKGNFTPLSILQSGIYIPGNGKALVKLRSASGKVLLAASQNRGPLKIFELKRNIQCVALQPDDVSVLIKYKDGKSHRQEIYYGQSFLSQSGRFLNIDDSISSVVITNSKGSERVLNFK